MITDRKREALSRFGHAFPALATATLALSVPSWLGIAALYPYTSPACFLTMITMFLSLIHTDIRDPDCRRCDRARGEDPQAAADRHLWSLWLEHRMNAHPARTWWLLVAGVVVTNVAFHFVHASLIFMPFDVTFVTMCWCAWRHFLLAPWCAYCRHGGGGGDHERIPDPVGHGTH